MKKSVRILSLIAAILLIGLFLAGLVFAFLDTPWSGSAMISCFLAALILSVLCYGTQLYLRHRRRNDIQRKE